MANISIWGGSSTFTTGSTPFGFYDTDSAFQTDADKVASFCATRLGFPLMDVELNSGSFYACFEEAITTYGNEIFQYKIRENYLSLEGGLTGSNLNNKLLDPTLSRVVQVSSNYGTEAGVGGNVTKYTGSLPLTSSFPPFPSLPFCPFLFAYVFHNKYTETRPHWCFGEQKLTIMMMMINH